MAQREIGAKKRTPRTGRGVRVPRDRSGYCTLLRRPVIVAEVVTSLTSFSFSNSTSSWLPSSRSSSTLV